MKILHVCLVQATSMQAIAACYLHAWVPFYVDLVLTEGWFIVVNVSN